MERKVYAIGEAILDIIFKKMDVQAAKPGGAMLNSAVSLARSGINTTLLSEYGLDHAGELIDHFLKTNGVHTCKIFRYKEGKTALAMAFLDEKSQASYDFYKFYPEQRMQIKSPPYIKDDIVLFGSYFGIDPRIRSQITNLVTLALQNEAIIVYDPNFRKPHAHQLNELRPFIRENMKWSHIIRTSHEDLEIIFGEERLSELSKQPQAQNKVLILTRGDGKVDLQTPLLSKSYDVKKLPAVSTIGAGDNFNAGLITGLIREKVDHDRLYKTSEEKWDAIISYANSFAADACMSYENYVSVDFGRQMARKGTE